MNCTALSMALMVMVMIVMLVMMVMLSGGQVTARGCATKDKVFHIECENHVMGRDSEKFCYCSYYLCNGSGATPGKSGGLAMLLALLWGVNLLWGGNLYGGNPGNLFLVDLPSGATELSAAIQRGPALQEPAPSRAILTCSDEVLGRRGLSRDFRLRALL